jgi:SAM-dependent methyltransferase
MNEVYVKQQHKTETEYKYQGITIHAAPGLHEYALELVRKNCKKNGLILDLGCGSGAFTKRLQDHGFRTSSVDLSLDTFVPDTESCELDLNTEFSGRFSSTAFDAIVALEVIEHLENPLQFLRQLKQLAGPETPVFISFPNMNMYLSLVFFFREGTFGDWSPFLYWETGHQTVMPVWLFEEHLKKTGLIPVEKHFCAPLPLPRTWRRLLHLAFIELACMCNRKISRQERENEAVLFLIRNRAGAAAVADQGEALP